MAKNKLNEAPPIDYRDGRERMSPDIEAKLRSQEHPLGGHKAFPDVDGNGIPDNFEELIASQRFQDVVEKVKDATGVENIDPRTLMSLQPMLMQAAQRVMEIESQNKQALEDLAVELVVDEMGIPEGDLQFDAKLGKPNMDGIQQKPNEKKKKKKKEPEFPNFEMEDEAAKRLEKLDLEKQKRRFINSLIQGSAKKAHYMYHLIREKLDEINPDLVGLYSIVMSVNDLLYWVMPDMEGMIGGGGAEQAMAGKEELDLETDPPTIKAMGLMFPILVHELYKGVMEYVSAHGLPSDPDMAEDVIGTEDTLPAEVWDLRLGPVIWEKFLEVYPDDFFDAGEQKRIKNYFYYKFVSLEAEEFLSLAKEILSGSQSGKDQVKDMIDGIVKQLKDEDWEDASGETQSTPDIPGFEGTIDALDDALNIRPKDGPKSVEPTQDLDMDTILDKINKLGMDSITKAEKDFLYNL
jgi:hypothetical protein|tara:strand:- start:242 stop:1633 length:1392 start_codon:yes stop_codon:yes gene_type:complete